jgi:hypothetical protein
MANKFSDLSARMTPAAQARSAVNAQQMLDAMPLSELRKARALSR